MSKPHTVVEGKALESEKKPNLFRRVFPKGARRTKVAAITGGLLATAAVAYTAGSKKDDVSLEDGTLTVDLVDTDTNPSED